MTDGVEEVALGTRCVLCGARAAGRGLFVLVIDVRPPGAHTVRRLVAVHLQCMRACKGS